MINAHIDYDAHFPPEYEAGHTEGLRLLRVAARARAEYGRKAVVTTVGLRGDRRRSWAEARCPSPSDNGETSTPWYPMTATGSNGCAAVDPTGVFHPSRVRTHDGDSP